ncbi:MAG: hypothetical protein CSA81_08385 [Acidobacteria bacterium]|nr:MAG: hypothetical protein CSA81_08385 [Acidobacteriota bacterium]PIE89742.1 MAG: hypothetical protein CR997_09920 [Acidobacteriota bacterium]
MSSRKSKILTALRTDFIAGIAVLLPLIGTIWFIHFLVTQLNNILLEPIMKLLTPLQPYADQQFVVLVVKAFILLIIILWILLLGLLVKSYFIRKLFNAGEGILMKVPFVSRIYKIIQQVSSTFLSQKVDMYNQVVLVEYPRRQCFVLGLMTTDCKGEIGAKLGHGFVNVFVPTTPNPTSGFLIMVDQKDVTILDMTAEDAMKWIVSSGIVTPEKVKIEPS